MSDGIERPDQRLGAPMESRFDVQHWNFVQGQTMSVIKFCETLDLSVEMHNTIPMPAPHRRLLALLLSASNHMAVPKSLQGAARGLWGHRLGHMVSIGHPPCGGMTARLTGRGRQLAESIRSESR